MLTESGTHRRQLIPFLWAGLFLLGFALRLYCLDCKLFQEDEGSTLYNIRELTLWQLVTADAEYLNPPFYRILLKIFSLVFGISEYALKFPSVLFDILGVGWMALLTRSCNDSPSFSWMAALLCAMSPALVLYSQLARPYPLIVFLAMGSLYCLCRYLENRKKGFLIGYLVLHALGVATHFLYLFLLVADTAFFLFTWKKRAKSFLLTWFAFCLALGLLLLPSLLVLWGEWHQPGGFDSPRPIPLTARTALLFFHFVLGESVYPFHWAVVLPAALLFGLLFLVGLKNLPRLKNGLLLGFRFFIPLLFWIAMKTAAPKYILYNVPLFLLIAAWGLKTLTPKTFWKVCITVPLLVLQSVSLFNWYSGNSSQILNANYLIPWREIMQELKQNQNPSDAILLYPNDHQILFQHYYAGPTERYLALHERDYRKPLSELLFNSPNIVWVVDMPRSYSRQPLSLGECYTPTYQKGFLSNPAITDHFKTGEKRYRDAVTLYRYQRLENCKQEVIE